MILVFFSMLCALAAMASVSKNFLFWGDAERLREKVRESITMR